MISLSFELVLIVEIEVSDIGEQCKVLIEAREDMSENSSSNKTSWSFSASSSGSKVTQGEIPSGLAEWKMILYVHILKI